MSNPLAGIRVIDLMAVNVRPRAIARLKTAHVDAAIHSMIAAGATRCAN